MITLHRNMDPVDVSPEDGSLTMSVSYMEMVLAVRHFVRSPDTLMYIYSQIGTRPSASEWSDEELMAIAQLSYMISCVAGIKGWLDEPYRSKCTLDNPRWAELAQTLVAHATQYHVAKAKGEL